MSDWIKIEVTTPDKPEVVAMAAALRVDQDAVAGKLFRVWAWADANSVNGEALPVTAAFLDRLTNRRGFADAMRSVGWVTGEDGSLSFPRFDRHNGASAKGRAESNRRMIKSRELRKNAGIGCGDVAEKPQQKPQPEIEIEKSTEVHTNRAPAPDADIPSEADVIAEGERLNPPCPPARCGEWLNSAIGRGWRDGADIPIHRWRNTFRGAWGKVSRAETEKAALAAHRLPQGHAAAGARAAALVAPPDLSKAVVTVTRGLKP